MQQPYKHEVAFKKNAQEIVTLTANSYQGSKFEAVLEAEAKLQKGVANGTLPPTHLDYDAISIDKKFEIAAKGNETHRGAMALLDRRSAQLKEALRYVRPASDL